MSICLSFSSDILFNYEKNILIKNISRMNNTNPIYLKLIKYTFIHYLLNKDKKYSFLGVDFLRFNLVLYFVNGFYY